MKERAFGRQGAHALDDIVARMKRVELFFRDEFDVDVYLSWGTLLGAMRDGDFIPFDTDVDVAYFSPMTADYEIVEEHELIRHVLHENDMLVTINSKGQIHIAAEAGSRTGQQDPTSIDLWTTWGRDGRYFHYPDIQGDLSVDAVLPLRRISLRGAEFWAPNRAEEVLAAFYGPGWRTPDPDYAWRPRRDPEDPFEFLRHERRDVEVPARPRRAGGLDIRQDGEAFVVRAPGRERPIRLNATAMLILEFCTGANTVRRIVALVQKAYRLESPPGMVVFQFLTEAVDEGLVDPAGITGETAHP